MHPCVGVYTADTIFAVVIGQAANPEDKSNPMAGLHACMVRADTV